MICCYYYCSIRSARKCDSKLSVGRACAPFGIRQVIWSLGKGFSQHTPPLQGMIQLRGTVDLYIPPKKFHQEQT